MSRKITKRRLLYMLDSPGHYSLCLLKNALPVWPQSPCCAQMCKIIVLTLICRENCEAHSGSNSSSCLGRDISFALVFVCSLGELDLSVTAIRAVRAISWRQCRTMVGGRRSREDDGRWLACTSSGCGNSREVLVRQVSVTLWIHLAYPSRGESRIFLPLQTIKNQL